MKATELQHGVDYLSTTDKRWSYDAQGWPAKERVRLIDAPVPYYSMRYGWGTEMVKTNKVDHLGAKKAALVQVIDRDGNPTAGTMRVLLSTLRVTWAAYEDQRAAIQVRLDAKADVAKHYKATAQMVNEQLDDKDAGVRLVWTLKRDFHGRVNGGQWTLQGAFGVKGAKALFEFVEEVLRHEN